MILSIATLVLAMAQTPSRPATIPEHIDVETLLAYLRGNGDEQQLQAMQRYAAQDDAPAGIPRLLEVMRSEAPRLDNNVGLALEFILVKHHDAPCDLEPLREGIRRHIWNSQQKCAQALEPLLERGDGESDLESIARDLIPLLASQRPRVFLAAQRCLKALTGEDLGDVPDRWLTWFTETFHEPIDMSGAVYEELVVVKSALDGEGAAARARYSIDGTDLTLDQVKERLASRQTEAKERKRELGISIQVTDARMQKIAFGKNWNEQAPDVVAVLDAATHLKIQTVVSPEADRFRELWSGAR
jgi:hypothetical protein